MEPLINNSTIPLKRKLSASYEENFPNKKLKKEPETLFSIPKELSQEILSYLNCSSLLNFETATNNSFETKEVWQKLKVRKGYHFGWDACKKEENRPKWEFCLSEALSRYILDYDFTFSARLDFTQALKIHRMYGGLTARFPILQEFIKPDIDECAGFEYTRDIFAFEKQHRDSILSGEAGETILYGLTKLRLTIRNDNFIKGIFSEAINKQATITSLFVNHLSLKLQALHLPFPYELTKELAIHAAHQGDERAIFELCTKDANLAAAIHSHHWFFSTLLILFYQTNDYSRIEEALAVQFNPLIEITDTSLLAYMNHALACIPDPVKKDKLLTRFFKIYGGDISAALLANAALVKQQLKQFQEADHLYSRTLNLYGEKAPVHVIFQAALVKQQLKQLQDSDHLYSRILNLYGEKTPAGIIAHAALVKVELAQFQEADRLYARTLNVHGEKASVKLLSHAALVKLKLGQFQEADHLYSRILNLYGEKAPANIIAHAAYIKLKLKEFQGAGHL